MNPRGSAGCALLIIGGAQGIGHAVVDVCLDLAARVLAFVRSRG